MGTEQARPVQPVDENHRGDAYYYGGYPGNRAGEPEMAAWVRLLWEFRILIIASAAMTTILGTLYAFLSTPVYTASTVLFLDRGSQKTAREVASVAATDLSTEMFLTSQADIMSSKEVAQDAVNTLNLKNHRAFAASKDPAAVLKGMIKVTRKRDTALYTISVTAPYQDDVAAWANAVAKAYDQVTLRQKLQFLSEADRLMGEQSQKMEKEYDRIKQDYGKYLSQTGSYFPENQRAITDGRIQGLEMRRNDVFMKKNEAAARLSQLKAMEDPNRDPLTVAFVQSDPAFAGLVQQYIVAEKELGTMSVKYTPMHPAIVKKTEELNSLKFRIRTQALNYMRAVQSEYSSYVQEYASLTGELDSLKSQAIQVTEGTSQSESLSSTVQAMRKYMELLSDKIREVDVAASLTNNAVRLVEKAETPGSPSKPRKARAVLLSFLLGLMGSIGAVAAIQHFDTRIKAPETIEKDLNLPLLATIPLHSGQSRAIVVEAFQNLRTSLIYCSDHKAKNIVMVTSASAGEGKSTIVSNLGITLASGGERVLLIDCDTRKSALHKYFQSKNEIGLSEYLASESEAPAPFLTATDKANLTILSAGKPPANPPTLFSMDKFKRLLKWAKTQYDWVIIDTPPVLAVTDASVIAAEAEVILLVARFRFTNSPLLEQAVSQLVRLDRPVAGIVFNQFEWDTHYYYRHYYSRHYGYYYKGEPPRSRWDKFLDTVTGGKGRDKKKTPSGRLRL